MADVKWKVAVLLLLGILSLPEDVQAGKKLKCPKGKVDVGCRCVRLAETQDEAKKWLRQDKRRAEVAIGMYHESMMAYARAWETYSAYVRVSKGCKLSWKRFFKDYQTNRVLRINSRRYIRRCDTLRAGLLRTIRYKKRFLTRIKFQKAWLKRNQKFLKKMTGKINHVKDYINDSCRFVHTLWVHQKTVAWTHTLAAKRKLLRLRIMLKPLIKTLALQRKQYRKQCHDARLKRQWKIFRSSRQRARITKRAAMRFKRCTRRAMSYAQIQVQSKMMVLREQASQSKVIYLRYLHKLALDKFKLCVANNGLSKCNKKKLLFADRDDSRKLFKKLTHAMYNEYRNRQQYFAKTLSKKWRDLRRKEGF